MGRFRPETEKDKALYKSPGKITELFFQASIDNVFNFQSKITMTVWILLSHNKANHMFFWIGPIRSAIITTP